MREIVLFLVFVVHTAAFLRLYVTRGRPRFHLLFVAAFAMLSVYQMASYGWPGAAWSSALRYGAWVLLAVASVLFLIDRLSSD
jgi:hypothetical protein